MHCMVSKKVWFGGILLVIFCQFSAFISGIDDDKLIFAHTLCRHGDRNIYYSYPNDPWKSERLYWSDGYAQLTSKGKERMFLLGEYLRNRYWNLLNNGTYSPNTVYIESSDVDRVLMSAGACLAGMFPPSADKRFRSNLDWIPIPVHTRPINEDYTLAAHKRCDRYEYAMINWLNTNEKYRGLFEKHKSLIEYLEEGSGKKLRTLVDINDLYDTLNLEHSRGMRLPEWAQKVMTASNDSEHFKYLSNYYFKIFTATPLMKRLKSGFLLKEVLDRLKEKIQLSLSPNLSIFLSFCHDNTLASLLDTLGVFELHQPPFSSCIFFDMYKNVASKLSYVQIFYKNTTATATDIPALEIPRCGKKCTLDELYEIYHDILPSESFESECALCNGEELPPGGNPENGDL